jgi:hypothetical protein
VKVLEPGSRLERYLIESVLAAREDAIVYTATEEASSRPVAITMLASAAGDDAALRASAERAERSAGISRMMAVEPIEIVRLEAGALVVNERDPSQPIIARSPAPMGLAFGAPTGEMDPGRAALSLKSERARRRAGGRMVRLVVRGVLLIGLLFAAWMFVR